MPTRDKFGSDFVSDSSFSVSSRKLSKTVFIDLDQAPTKAKVVRGGFQVPGVLADNNRIDELLSGLEILRPTRAPRVVAQSIAAGIKVGPGTEVDLVLTSRGNVPLRVFDDIHVAARDTSVEDMLTRIEGSEALQALVLKYDDADEVSDDDRAAITQALSAADLSVDDTRPETSFRAGFNTVRTTLAFK